MKASKSASGQWAVQAGLLQASCTSSQWVRGWSRLPRSIHRKQARCLWHLSPFCWGHTIVSDLPLVKYLSKWHPKCQDCWIEGNKTLKIVNPTLLSSSWDKQLCSRLRRPVFQFLNMFTPYLGTTTHPFNGIYFLLSPRCMSPPWERRLCYMSTRALTAGTHK